MKQANSVVHTWAAGSGSACQPPLALKAGDWVRVRSREEIEKTLDSRGECLGCLHMSEMWQYCGTIQRVLKPVQRYLDECDYKIRQCRGVVLLDGIICQGSAFPEGCDCSCPIFWREEWLELLPGSQTT